VRDPVTPLDSGLDLALPAERAEPRPSPIPVIATISAGGVLGAVARYAVSAAWPHRPDGFAWSTWSINVSGCLLIGVLMVLISEVWVGHRLLRPFLGVGVLGGYTTFSTSIVDVQQAAAHGAAGVAFVYLGATLLGAMLAVWVGSAVTAWAIRTRPRRKGR
jgi:CrcB protein